MHDLVIRGGTVVDGTGRPAARADVAIDGEVVTEVGTVRGSAWRTLDADGLVVTPGFIDPHTHLDAQLLWDPLGTPACWHGTTTVVIGNCGVGFAPLRPSACERLPFLRSEGGRAALVRVSDAANERAGRELHLFGPERCEYQRRPERRLDHVAAAAGETPAEAALRLLDESDGRQLFASGGANQVSEHVEEVFRHPGTLIGLGDAGAHVTSICDASMTTWALTYWCRERGALTLEETVRRLTSEPADVFGIPRRGRLAPGAFADVNVIDLEALDIELPEFATDFPAHAGRWTQGARGYEHTIVNGQVAIEAGRHTGRLAGRLVRGEAARAPARGSL